jgi:predicted N-acetyltransferase YhbS
MITPELPQDAPAREALLDRAFGPRRHAKTCARLRQGCHPALAFAARDEAGQLVGTVRLWHIDAGTAGPALLLGPIAVDQAHRKQGLGAALMNHAIAEAKSLGHRAILLVGDAPYYARFGFSGDKLRQLYLPGPYDPNRFLGLELKEDALAKATGIVAATGELEPRTAKAA